MKKSFQLNLGRPRGVSAAPVTAEAPGLRGGVGVWGEASPRQAELAGGPGLFTSPLPRSLLRAELAKG